MTSPDAVTVVFYGQDEPTLRERLTAFCAEVVEPAMADLNTSRLDGRSAALDDIAAAAGSLPFLSDLRLVLVDNLTELSNGRAIIDALPELLPDLPDSTRLLFVESGLEADHPGDTPAERKRKAARRQALKKLVNVVENDPRGRAFHFDVPRNPVQWVMQRAEQYGAAIDTPAAQALLQRIGTDLVAVDSEIVKLATYTGGQRPIAAEDVALLTPYTPEAGIFDLVDALGQRQGDAALHLLRQLLDDGDDPLRIFGMIVRQYRLLIQMREHLDSGQSVGSAAATLGMHEYVAKKMAAQARHYSLPLLERIYRYLLETDLDMKTGRIDPSLALETLIARLSAR